MVATWPPASLRFSPTSFPTIPSSTSRKCNKAPIRPSCPLCNPQLNTGDIQCNDQHGRSNGTGFCQFDPNDNGTQDGLNPALIPDGRPGRAENRQRHPRFVGLEQGEERERPDLGRERLLCSAINQPGSGHYRHQVWLPPTHQQRLLRPFSLLRTLEGGFKLPCLNHACDANTQAMTDLFGEQ